MADVLDFWPADSSQEGVRCEGQGRIEGCRAGQGWSFQPVITHHHYLLVLQRLNGSARAAIKHLSFTAGRFFFSFSHMRTSETIQDRTGACSGLQSTNSCK